MGKAAPYDRTGQAELYSVITKHQKLVNLAIQAVKDNNLKRVQCNVQDGKESMAASRTRGMDWAASRGALMTADIAMGGPGH